MGVTLPTFHFVGKVCFSIQKLINLHRESARTDRNKRGQTCCLDERPQIQTSCNFERNVASSIPLAKIYLVDGFPCISCAFPLLICISAFRVLSCILISV